MIEQNDIIAQLREHLAIGRDRGQQFDMTVKCGVIEVEPDQDMNDADCKWPRWEATGDVDIIIKIRDPLAFGLPLDQNASDLLKEVKVLQKQLAMVNRRTKTIWNKP